MLEGVLFARPPGFLEDENGSVIPAPMTAALLLTIASALISSRLSGRWSVLTTLGCLALVWCCAFIAFWATLALGGPLFPL